MTAGHSHTHWEGGVKEDATLVLSLRGALGAKNLDISWSKPIPIGSMVLVYMLTLGVY